MKHFSLFAFLSIILFSLTVLSCKKDDDGDNSDDPNNLKTGHVEIKGYAGEKDKKMSFKAAAKTVTIDWGDGKIDEITPNGAEKEFVHEYASSSDFQTILVKTEDLTEIDFDDSDGSIHELRFGNCPKLQEISCHSSLTVFEINKAEALTTLYISGNELTSLNLNGCTALTDLGCEGNQLTSLDVSKCTALTFLNCWENQLTSLDVSKCTALTELYCSENQLTSLDVSKCTALTFLYCERNQLTSLDVSKCPALTALRCGSNELTSLDVSKCTALVELYCRDNQLNAAALNSLFSGLHNYDGSISCSNNPGSNDCDTSIAENKGWRVSN